MSTISDLRQKHACLTYETFKITESPATLTIEFLFVLAPGVAFRPEVTIPRPYSYDKASAEIFAFHLGLVESISYWKAACPAQLIVRAGRLALEQIRWWHALFLSGLGEFFYVNDIDFTGQDFLEIVVDTADSPVVKPEANQPTASAGDLLMVGAGKDSAVSLEILKASDTSFQSCVLNPTPASLANIRNAGVDDPIVVRRKIDPRLLSLNAKGYLNGHTPFSAYLAFLGTFVGYLYGCDRVLVSNEASANEGNVLYRGTMVNHQYSKSFAFEQAFRSYAAEYLPKGAEYVSLLRPLGELQIAAIFSKHPKYFHSFRSCNAGSKTGAWCRQCPKCAFVYISLLPFVGTAVMCEMFGLELFSVPEIQKHIRGLVGIETLKPFECVGTRDESRLALLLCHDRYKREGKAVPEALSAMVSSLGISPKKKEELKASVLAGWNKGNVVPDEYQKLLSEALVASSNF